MLGLGGWALRSRSESGSSPGCCRSDRQEVTDAATLRESATSSGGSGQRARPRQGPGRPARDRVDVRLPGAGARPPRLLASASPAAMPSSARRSRSRTSSAACRAPERQARQAIRSLPRILLPERDHPGPPHGQHRASCSRRCPPDRRQEVIDDMRAQLDPPAGVTAELAGQPVIDAATQSRPRDEPLDARARGPRCSSSASC